mgnify:CR=1 FL=1
MAVGNKKIVQGVETLELAVIDGVTGVAGPWVRAENVAPGTVNYTSNADTETSIIPEDKDVAIIVLSTPGDPDQFNFGLLELSDENYAKLFNVEQDLTTSTTTILATRKKANLAIRLTTRPLNGVKKIFLYPNTQCTTTYVNNFTKDALVQFGVVASVLSYTSVGGKDAIYSVQTVKADGSSIDGTPPAVSAGANSTTTAPTKALIGVVTPVSPKTISSYQWSQVSGPNTAGFSTPNALTTSATGLVTGTYVFQLTAVDSDGVSASATTQVVATIA